jgi:hypothetical protein
LNDFRFDRKTLKNDGGPQPVAAGINYFDTVCRNRNFTIRQRTRFGVAILSQVATSKVTKFRSLSVRLRAV